MSSSIKIGAAIIGFAIACSPLSAGCDLFLSADDGHDVRPHDDADCKKNEPPSEEQIADILCKYSLGAFPNWTEYPAYREYLAFGEEAAFAYMADALVGENIPFYRARYRAIGRFTAENTRCISVPEENAVDETGAMMFTFQQTVPTVPFIPDIDKNIPADQSEAAWLDAIEKSWQGETYQRRARIVLEPSPHGYVMRTNVRRQYMEPLQRQRLWKSLESLDLDNTRRLLDKTCAFSKEVCREFLPHYEAVSEFSKYFISSFSRDIEVENLPVRLVQQSGKRQSTVFGFKMTNRSTRIYKNIYAKTVQPSPQVCELRTSDGLPAELRPGTAAEFRCVISGSLPPQIAVMPFYGDILSP